LIAMFLWVRFPKPIEDSCRSVARSWKIQLIGLCLLLAGITLAGLRRADWSTTIVILMAILGGCFFIYNRDGARSRFPSGVIATAASTAALLMVAAGTVPKLSSFWNPVIEPDARDVDWRNVQQWAKTNTSQDTHFLVPTYPGGFRAFSERSSWGEWKDGQAMYHFPPSAQEYRRRMQAVGYPWPGPWMMTPGIQAGYRKLSWERLLAIARENHLSYIIQFRDVQYPVAPVFANQHYAVYKVPPE
jgi:hypothetical protein